jgi:hypothetical protein
MPDAKTRHKTFLIHLERRFSVPLGEGASGGTLMVERDAAPAA